MPADRASDLAPTARAVRPPALTYGLLAVLAACFALEQEVPVTPSAGFLEPSTPTLLALGAQLRTLSFGGEPYRLVTAAFLHASPLHLVFNGVALWLAGVFLERLVGRAWLLGLFFLGAVGGGLGSALLNAPGALSVGASGAIMALLAVMGVLSFRLPAGAARRRAQLTSLQVLVPSLLPVATALGTHERVDLAAHLGGALLGAVAGGALLLTWKQQRPRVPVPWLGGAFAVLGMGVLAWGGVMLARDLPAARVGAGLIPNEQIPQTGVDLHALAPELVKKYPGDPRGHLFLASVLLQDQELPEGEKELRAALERVAPARQFFKPELEMLIRRELAQVLLGEDKNDEAKTVAAPVCGHAHEDAELVGWGLCP